MFAPMLPAPAMVSGTVPVFVSVSVTGAWLFVMLRGIGFVALRVAEATSGHGSCEVNETVLVSGVPHSLVSVVTVKVTEDGRGPLKV